MGYRAIVYFTDLQDNNFEYHAGDIYPRQGYEPTAERIAELSSDANKRKRPVIAAIEEDIPDVPDAPDAPEVPEAEDTADVSTTEPVEPKKKRKGRNKDA